LEGKKLPAVESWNNALITKESNAQYKIVATLGPASSDAEILKRMIQAGVDVVRMNFSHGKVDDHIKRVKLVRSLAVEVNRPIGIMADLQGQKSVLASLRTIKLF